MGRGSRTRQAAGISSLGASPPSNTSGNMAEPGVGRSKIVGCVSVPSARLRFLFGGGRNQSGLRAKNKPNLFAMPHPPARPCCFTWRQAKLLREDKPVAGYDLEPRPTKALEDEDDTPL